MALIEEQHLSLCPQIGDEPVTLRAFVKLASRPLDNLDFSPESAHNKNSEQQFLDSDVNQKQRDSLMARQVTRRDSPCLPEVEGSPPAGILTWNLPLRNTGHRRDVCNNNQDCGLDVRQTDMIRLCESSRRNSGPAHLAPM